MLQAQSTGNPHGASIDEQETVSHSVEAGDLAGGLQAWLRLTNNTEMFGSEDTCIPEDSNSQSPSASIHEI